MNFISEAAKRTYRLFTPETEPRLHDAETMPVIEKLDESPIRSREQASDAGANAGTESGADAGAEADAGANGSQQSDSFVKDRRESGCVAPPYDQRDYLSCYALSSMAFFEFAFCMN